MTPSAVHVGLHEYASSASPSMVPKPVSCKKADIAYRNACHPHLYQGGILGGQSTTIRFLIHYRYFSMSTIKSLSSPTCVSFEPWQVLHPQTEQSDRSGSQCQI